VIIWQEEESEEEGAGEADDANAREETTQKKKKPKLSSAPVPRARLSCLHAPGCALRSAASAPADVPHGADGDGGGSARTCVAMKVPG
jgi:hypothetical protein